MDNIQNEPNSILQESQSSAIIYDNNPYINILMDCDFNVIDCNIEAVKCFGFSSKEELFNEFISVVNNSSPIYRPVGRKEGFLYKQYISTVMHGYNEFDYELLIDERLVVFNVISKRIAFGDSFVVAFYGIERREVEERMQLMLDAMPLACIFMDEEYRIMDCNLEVVKMFGFAGKEECIRRFKEVIPNFQADGSNSLQLLRSKVDEAFKTGKTVFKFRYRQLSGKNLPIEITMVRVNWKGAYVVSAYGRDLGMLEETKNELRRHACLIQAVNEVATNLITSNTDKFGNAVCKSLGIMGKEMNVDCAYVWRNYRQDGKLYLGHVYSWSKDEKIKGISDDSSILYDDVPYWKEQVLSKKTINGSISDLPEAEKNMLISKGVKSVLLIPIYFRGEPWGHIGFDDYKEERVFSKADEQVLRSGGVLIVSAMIRNEVTENLIEAKENALESTRAKTEFLSRMSHEIRTPMNAIIGMATLAKKCTDMSKMQYYLDNIDVSSQQLLGIINDVLDMSKIDANKLEIVYKEFDFEGMMRHVFNVMQVKIDEKKINFKLDFPTAFFRNVISDELRFSQVLINLLSNAVKFTPDYGEIEFKVDETLVDEKHSFLQIEITDTGIGIEPEYLSSIFQSFEQGDGSITRKYGGTGLGLAICKKIIDLMGGDIWVESEYGKGTKFIIKIKIEWGNECKDRLKIKELHSDLSILVVDDNPEELEYFKDIFASFSLLCDTALSAGEAIDLVKKKKCENKPYDVIFLDYYMPQMNGGEAAVEIKRIMGEDVSIIITSCADWNEIEKDISRSNISDFLPKPILSLDLYHMLIQLTESVDNKEEMKYDYNWSGKTMLLVEDIEINREIVMGILEDTNIAIECAENGLKAVDMYKANSDKYDVILMDVQMPVLDGLSATRQIRACGMPGSDTIPIIAMTANAFKEDERVSFEAGMNGHIAKPIDVGEIFKILKNYLTSSASPPLQ